jgi:hypothetical protein
MSKKRKYKIQSVIVSVPAAGVANQVYFPSSANTYKPDESYKNVIGVWVKVLSLSTASYVLAQLKDQYNVVIDPVHTDLLTTGDAAGANDKFRAIEPIPCDGRQVIPGIQVPNSPAAQVDVLFTFLLSDELFEVANVTS